MNVSSKSSIGNQYVSSASTQRTHHNHSAVTSGKDQDTAEVSADAREKYAQSQVKSDSSSSDAATSDNEEGGKPVGGPPHGGPPSGGPPPNGGAHGKGSSSSDNADTVKDILAALTDEEDTNGDGVVDERDEQTSASKAATELKSKLTDWLAGDKKTTVGSYESLVQQLSSMDSTQEESAS